MSGKITLIQQVAQIDRRRYERLSACARKRLDPYRFWNDANRAHRCPKPQPPLRLSDQIVFQNRMIQHQRHLTLSTDQKRIAEMTGKERQKPRPLPLVSRQITRIDNLALTRQTKITSAGIQVRNVLQIERIFRQTLTVRLHTLRLDPLDQQVQLDMIQLAHEWGIHVYRAQTITEQIIRDMRIKQSPSSKAHPFKRPAKKNEGRPLPPFSPLHRNALLVILITLAVLIDLAIFYRLF